MKKENKQNHEQNETKQNNKQDKTKYNKEEKVQIKQNIIKQQKINEKSPAK